MNTHRFLTLSQPRLMAIVNATPDSFSDGGLLMRNRRVDLTVAGARIRQLLAEGAEIIDIGGESTRPGARPVSVQEELDRVIPLVQWVAEHCDVAISVDSSAPEVMAEAAKQGAHLLNDVRALAAGNALSVAAKTGLPVCLMHMQGMPATMQQQPQYHQVVSEVAGYLRQRADACVAAGIAPGKIWLDPGFGFGKTLEHNLALLRQLPAITGLGYPVLVGFSRKSMIGRLLGRELPDRLPGSLALAMMALERGARVLRVHDVAATRDIIDTFMAVRGKE